MLKYAGIQRKWMQNPYNGEDKMNQRQEIGLKDSLTNNEVEVLYDKPFHLKCPRKYHTQVQHLMFICQKQYCQRITPTVKFRTNFPKLEKFFGDFIAPEMFTRKLLAKHIAILRDIVDSTFVGGSLTSNVTTTITTRVSIKF